MRRWLLGVLTTVAVGAGLAAAPGAPAWATDEREATFPDGTGSVPVARVEGLTLLVCKTDPVDFTLRTATFEPELLATNQALWEQCQTEGFRHVQEAIDAVTGPGAIIKILPGEYREEPSLVEPSAECAALPPTLDFEQQVACPHAENLIAVLGKQQLQIEGTGATPADVTIDAAFRTRHGIRVDRSPGFYLRNLTVQRATSSAVYVLETDGFVLDTVVSRWNDSYGLYARAIDHGLLTGCEAYGNGHSGIAADLLPYRGGEERYTLEVAHCDSHNNLLGFSGTGANSLWVHDNRFSRNSVGVATDSAPTGPPQSHAIFERNVIGNNDSNYYEHVRDGTCSRPSSQRGYEEGVLCPAVGVPPGTGVLTVGGNDNVWRENWIYANGYAGIVSASTRGLLRGHVSLTPEFDASYRNRFYGNHLGLTPEGETAPNRIDVWWDGRGRDSCWQESSTGTEPIELPRCTPEGTSDGRSAARFFAEPGKVALLHACAGYDLAAAHLPADCVWYGSAGLDRIEIQFAFGEAVLLGLVLIVVWSRLLLFSGLALLGLLLSLAGLVVGIFGTAGDSSALTPVGLNLLGAGWVVVGVMLYRKRRPALGFLTVALGVITLIGAVDRGVWMIPYVPVPPSLWRIALEFFWVPTALIVAIRRRRTIPVARKRPARRPRRTGDALEAYTAKLRF